MQHESSSEPTRQSGGTARVLTVAAVLVAIGIASFPFWNKRLPLGGDLPSVHLRDVMAPKSAEGFNLLLITMDTTRADRLGCYGYAPAETPNIDALAAHGVRFDDAVTSVPITLPSHTVMMTGKYPPTTGVRTNGTDRLVEAQETLAEKLRDAGYSTGAFVSAFVLDQRFGLNQGFDTYDFAISPNLVRHSMTLHNERRADEVTRNALNWLEEQPTDKPFFMWVHYFDPHAPYVSPIESLPSLKGRPYDAEIAFVDTQIRRLVEALDKSNRRERTLIALTSDHGEALGEHGEGYHSIFVYEATMRAVMILSCPALFDQAHVVRDDLVGMVDLNPTLISALGIPKTDATDGINLLETNPTPDRAIYMETLYPSEHLACGPLYALRRHHDKFILAPREEYYDLRADPGELDNSIDARTDDARVLRTQLDTIMASFSSTEDQSSAVALSNDDVQRLAALGYVVGPTDGGTDDRECDPKDHIEVINGMSKMAQLINDGQFDEAIRFGTELAANAEGWPEPVRRVASIYAERNQWDKAIEVLDRFVKQHPEPDMVLRLAYAYDQAGMDQACEQTLEVAERLEPKFGAIYVLRGERAERRGDDQLALTQYHRALEVDAERIAPDVQPRIYAITQRLEKSNP